MRRNSDPRAMQKERLHIRPIAVVVATIVLLGAAIYAALMTIAHVGDAHQRETEQRIVESALAQQRIRLSGMLVQQAVWDMAYQKVGETIDVRWADTNLGKSGEIAGVPITMIFDSHLQPVYRYSVPATTADAAEAGRSASLSSLARAALAAPPYPPVPATAFARVRHTIYFAAAQRIEPFEAPAGHLLNKRYALVYLLPVDAAMLRALQSGFHVAPLAVLPKPEPGAAHVPLASADGMPLAWLSWISARPGADFANAAAPLAVACFIVLAALQILVLRSWMEVAKRMQAESVARSAFLANTSHELRTPLNAIIGFSDCMVGEMFGPLSPRYREYARDIKTSGQLLLGIVNDVLDLTQLNNTSDFPMKPLNPGEALIGAVRMLREYAKADHISVDYVDASGGAQVAGSEKALSQILLNLGSNAVKFSPPQSSIDVVLRRGPDCVELVVRDYGMGIPADKLSHIGQPFFQAHAGNARKPGSGLGLAIVKKLTERLGGEFAIASTLGAGTTVTVRLPQLKLPSEPTRARAA